MIYVGRYFVRISLHFSAIIIVIIIIIVITTSFSLFSSITMGLAHAEVFLYILMK